MGLDILERIPSEVGVSFVMLREELECFESSVLRDPNLARISYRSLSNSARRDSPWEMADIK